MHRGLQTARRSSSSASRRVTIVTHWVDYRLWPNSAGLMHLQSLIWFGSLVAIAAVLYRRVLGPTWIAGLAALLYALDDAHGYPAGWLANRNALVATTFGCLALVAHDRWRRDGWRPGGVVAPGFLALALLSAEFGAGVVAYLLAHALFLEGASPSHSTRDTAGLETSVAAGGSARMLALWPHSMVFVAWLLAHHALGYGAFGSEYYIDPLRQPGSFAWALLERGPVLLHGQWALPPADAYGALLGGAAVGYWFAGFVTISLLACLAAAVSTVGRGALLGLRNDAFADPSLCYRPVEPTPILCRPGSHGPAGTVSRRIGRRDGPGLEIRAM